MLCVRIAEKGQKLSENFQAKEFACGCCGMVLVHPELIRKLEALRNVIGCADHNRVCGGVENSYHTSGMAADIYSDEKNVNELAEIAENVGFDGITKTGSSVYLHMSTR
ncbi:MAG: Peptidase M15 [Pelotomaculum sp. PtaU1.Bin035]|nr:MAG: Peptidase M15 [Pelotomaculum sp. PtaU1.Bin035]